MTSVVSGIGTFSYIGSIATLGIQNPFGTGTTDVEIWGCPSVTGAAKTVTVSTTGANNYIASAYEIANASSLSYAGSNSASSGTNASLVFTGLTVGSLCLGLTNNGAVVSTAPPGWTSYNGSGGQFTYGNGLDTAYITAASSIETATWTMPSQNWYTIGVVALVAAPSFAPSQPPRSFTAVSRAANWMKRETGLWSPESGLRPRLA